MTIYDRFNMWQFLHNLVHFRPPEFKAYQQEVRQSEILEQISVIKSSITPLRATFDNNSKIAGNIDTIHHVLKQASIGNSKMNPSIVDVSEHVVIFHGDVGMGEKVDAMLKRKALEYTPWERMQHVIFVNGAFHLKMACTNALWHIFLR